MCVQVCCYFYMILHCKHLFEAQNVFFFCMFQWNTTMRTKRFIGISFRSYWIEIHVLTTFLESKRLFWRVISWLNKNYCNFETGRDEIVKSCLLEFFYSSVVFIVLCCFYLLRFCCKHLLGWEWPMGFGNKMVARQFDWVWHKMMGTRLDLI